MKTVLKLSLEGKRKHINAIVFGISHIIRLFAENNDVRMKLEELEKKL